MGEVQREFTRDLKEKFGEVNVVLEMWLGEKI
jgi:hypothetical protein